MSALTLGDMGIFHGQYESALSLKFREFAAFAGSAGSLKGTGEHEIGGTAISVSKSRGAVVSPGCATLHYGPNFEHFSMTVRPAALTAKLAAIVGDLRLGPLRFEPAAHGSDPESARLDRLVRFVAAEANVSWPLPHVAQMELQQAMMALFLVANTNNYSGLLRGEPLPAAPWQVRRAEEYIVSNWDQPITVEGLAAVTNVSARNLFRTFKTTRGYTPMEFAKRVRIKRAWQKLSKPDAVTSVTAVAYECGFGNLGHFAKDYQRQVGELPSETLTRLRGA